MNKLKRYGLMALAASPMAVFAEGESVNNIDFTQLTPVVNELKTEVAGLFTGDVLNAVAAILGGVIVVWALLIIWKWIKQVAGR